MEKRAINTIATKSIVSALTLWIGVEAASAQTQNQFQDAARPFGIGIAGPVMQAASDAASASFQQNDLPGLLNFVNANLSESQSLADVAAVALDPSKLTLGTDSTVRTYFLSEGAGYRNTLGYTPVDAQSGATGSQSLIFPDASSHNQYFAEGLDVSSDNTPLAPGDFVDLGTYNAGTLIDFFLIADGANGGNNTYTADSSSNPDGIQHIVSYAIPGSPYLIIGFEDLFGGGDMDYNDLVFAVDIGAANVEKLVSVAAPEPSTWALMGITLAIAGWRYRKGAIADAA